MSERVRLDQIVFDGGTQIRVAIDETAVAEYADRMTDGVVFPPIVLFHDGVNYYLADGFHRTLAAKRNQFRELEADISLGTRADALWFALGANKTNGQRLTDADKRQAIRMALEAFPDKSQNQIAEQVGCSQQYVATIKSHVTATCKVARVIGKDGKSYPASRVPADKAVENPKIARIKELLLTGVFHDEIRRQVGGVSNSTITTVRRSLGMGDPTDKSRAGVEARKQRIRQLAAEGYTTRQIAADTGIGAAGISVIAKREGIDVQADRVIGRARRHKADRIVEHMVMDAENLCADVELIDFTELDTTRIAAWLTSLNASKRALSAFIRHLEQEHKKHVEAA